MFGIQSPEQVAQIAEGWTKKVLNKEQQLLEKRLPICKECPLMSNTPLGLKCDNHKWYNPTTGDITDKETYNYINGCGCYLDAALRVQSKQCVLGNW